MTKLLLLIFVVAVVWRLAKGFGSKGVAGGTARPAPEQMVRCAHCDVYLPQSEALGEGNRYFCCAEHRRLAG